MIIYPEITGTISATLLPSADLARGAVRLGLAPLSHQPPLPALLGTAVIAIPTLGSVELDFKTLALLGHAASRDAEGRTLDYREITCLALHSTQPLHVTAGSWAASPLPQQLRMQAASGSMRVSTASRTASFTNPSETQPAVLTLLVLGTNHFPGAFTYGGAPLTYAGTPITL